MSNIRIPVNINSDEENVRINLDQDFDNLNILSLNISDTDLYNTECGDFGVIVGRVNINQGFGVANAKVSVFIPIEDDDLERPEILKLYPFKDIDDTFNNGLRYNLLPRIKSGNSSHKPVGSFPDISDFSHYPTYLEVYDKYYKYTTTTNDSGDFMIYGVPLGIHTIHMDFDIFDTPSFNVSANDLVANTAFFENLSGEVLLQEEQGGGFNSDLIPNFNYNGNGNYEVVVNNNIDEMPNIFSETKQVNVISFWGEGTQCEVGITRVDFSIDYDLRPNAVFFGSFLEMDSDYHINKDYEVTNFNLSRPNIEDDTTPAKSLKLVVYSLDRDTLEPGSRERLGVFNEIEPGTGVFKVNLPMYQDFFITNEYGQIIPSDNDTGIPTSGRYAFELFEADEKAYGRRGDLNEGYDKYIQPGVKIPSKDGGNPYAGGWTGTWSGTSLFSYDVFNTKQKYYTIKTTYRKHIPGDVGIGGAGTVIEYLPRIKQNYTNNFPLSSTDDDTSVIGCFLVPKVEFKSRFQQAGNESRLYLDSPSKIISLPFLSRSQSNGVILRDYEYVLGVGVGENGTNKQGVWYDLFDDNLVDAANEVRGFNFGDNDDTGLFNAHAYATLLSAKSNNIAFGTEEETLNSFTVHPHYNFAMLSNETGLVTISGVEDNGKQKWVEVDIVEVTDDIDNLIQNNVYTSYGLPDNKFNNKRYFFGKKENENALWWLKNDKNG